MQHELEALRQGLSGRQAAALEAARGEYAAALADSQAQLEAAQRRGSEQSLLVQRQSKALASILRILAVHAGEEELGLPAGLQQHDMRQAQHSGGAAAGAEPGAAGPAAVAAPDPDKVVAFVEAVSASMLDVQQAWQLEKGEMAAALEAAEAVHGQLEALLERERGDNRGMTAEAVELRGAAQELEAELEVAQQLLHEVGWRELGAGSWGLLGSDNKKSGAGHCLNAVLLAWAVPHFVGARFQCAVESSKQLLPTFSPSCL